MSNEHPHLWRDNKPFHTEGGRYHVMTQRAFKNGGGGTHWEHLSYYHS